MKRKFLVFGITIFVVLIATLHVLIWRMSELRDDQYLVRVYSDQISNISQLFFRASTVQQQQLELKLGSLRDITPFVDNVLEIDRLIERVESDLEQPELVASCVSCHSRAGDTRWRAMPDKLVGVKRTLAQYKLQMSEVITARGTGLKADLERRALQTGKQLVARSGEFQGLFATILNHVIDESDERRNRIVYEVLAVFLLGVVVISLLFVRFSKKMVKPIVSLAEATNALSSGRFPEPIEVRTNDEVELLATAFNNMVQSLERVMAERERLLGETQSFNEELELRIEEAKEQLARAHEQLLRQEKLSAIGTLASGVAHEISNPIHIVQGMCAILLEDLDKGSPLADDLTLIDKEVGRCQRIVEELLDFARLKEVHNTSVNVNELVQSTLEMVKRRRGARRLTFHTELGPEVPAIHVDADRLKQVLVNLVLNAMDAMEQSGTITIGTSIVDDNVKLVVKDTGKGIAPENLGRIFDPFFTTKKGSEGTGLGLSVCYRIIEEYGGTIEVESHEGRGTLFTVQLPLTRNVSAASSENHVSQEHSGENQC